MGLLDIFRKKREEVPDFNNNFSEDQVLPEDIRQNNFQNSENFNNNFSEDQVLPEDNLSLRFPTQNSFSQPPQLDINSKDIQLILAKLDYLSQKLELMDRRLQLIEQIAKESR